MAGDWAVDERIVNLSYFIPYAYPDFARADPAGRWPEVTTLGYALLQRVLQSPGVVHRYYDLSWVWFGIAAAEGLLERSDHLRCAENRPAVPAQAARS